ncbi:cytochrome c [Methylopila sp. M107]|uniref:c-type cytochrome n=1 Tax=Methylopila sp. M107 TaxID=1101190 RepID=UPI00036599FB|nr:cytochrome c [Methylopila sp. M107]
MKLKTTLAAAAFGASLMTGPAVAFTQDQADKGKSEYNTHCRTCHGSNGKGALGPALAGDPAKQKWGGKPSSEYRAFVYENMPQTAPKTLSDEQLDALTAYTLSLNGATPGDKPYAKEDPFPK